MKKWPLLLLLHCLALGMNAHEFWIQPDRFLYEPYQSISLRFWVGENFDGKNWTGNNQSVIGIFVSQQRLSDSLTENLGAESGDSLELSFQDEGTAMITLQTKNKHIFLDAVKFREYLEEDGLQDVLDYRAAHQETDSAAGELYQRAAKTIVQVGDQLSNNCLQETGLPVDIIPLQNPYDPALKDSLRFQVKYRGLPMANQLMKAWHRTNNQTQTFDTRTNAKGVFSVPLERNGKWMVSTVHMIRITAENAQWQSYWASCTWGYY